MAGKLHSDQVLLQNQRPALRAETHVDGYPTAIDKKSHNAMAPVNKKVYSKSEGLIFVFKLEMVIGSNFGSKLYGPRPENSSKVKTLKEDPDASEAGFYFSPEISHPRPVSI